MFDYLSCGCDVTRHSQIGRPSNRNSKSIRSFKVEFKSVSVTSSILSRANRLRLDDYYVGVYINKWLSNEDMKSMQQLRSQCERLNNDLSPSVNGRKQFVVISGKIKQRNASDSCTIIVFPITLVQLSMLLFLHLQSIQKRVCRWSNDSLSVIASIANQSATEYNDMCKRHAALNEQLRAKRLQTVNVESDGNCLFRAVSYLLTGSEDSSRASLRASVASHIESTGKVLGGVINITPEDLVSEIGISALPICV